ncbi:hypothetical protein [Bacillus mycoides]
MVVKIPNLEAVKGLESVKKEELENVVGGLSKAQCAYLWSLCGTGGARFGSVGIENTCRLAIANC